MSSYDPPDVEIASLRGTFNSVTLGDMDVTNSEVDFSGVTLNGTSPSLMLPNTLFCQSMLTVSSRCCTRPRLRMTLLVY